MDLSDILRDIRRRQNATLVVLFLLAGGETLPHTPFPLQDSQTLYVPIHQRPDQQAPGGSIKQAIGRTALVVENERPRERAGEVKARGKSAPEEDSKTDEESIDLSD